MKLLLIYPDYPTKWDPEESPFGYYSEGLASISAVLKGEGHDVSIYHLKHPPIKGEVIDEVDRHSPDLIAITCRTTLFEDVVELAKYIKEEYPETPLLVGGYHATLTPRSFVDMPKPPFDYICLGEGEYPTLELLSALKNDRDPSDIESLWIKRDGDYITNPTRPLIEDLDTLPLPDLSLYDYDKLYSLRLGIAPVMISRGCPFRCTYCCNHQIRKAYPNEARYVRYRSPEGAIEYIKNVLDTVEDIQYINFMDNILPLKKRWFYEFVDLYKREIDLPFSARYHAGIYDREVVEKLSEGGCYQLHLGVESGNAYLRDNILKRRMTDEQIIEVFNACREVGISTLSYNIVGLPYENKERFLETIKLNARIKPSRRILSVFYPYPETDLYKIAEEANFLTSNFDLKEEHYLSQPQFTHEEVLFCQRSFSLFITVYKFLHRLPLIGRLMERLVDRIYTNRRIPHRFFISILNGFQWTYSKLKSLVGRLSPRLYQSLRRRLLRS